PIFFRYQLNPLSCVSAARLYKKTTGFNLLFSYSVFNHKQGRSIFGGHPKVVKFLFNENVGVISSGKSITVSKWGIAYKFANQNIVFLHYAISITTKLVL